MLLELFAELSELVIPTVSKAAGFKASLHPLPSLHLSEPV